MAYQIQPVVKKSYQFVQVNQMIVSMEKEHAKDVGKLHHCFVGSFLKDLGERVCIQFYKTAIIQDHNFGFVYYQNSTILGFAFGTMDNSKLFEPLAIKIELLWALLKKPSMFARFLHRIKNKFPAAPEGCYAATDLSIRGKGIGKQLYRRINKEFKRRGINVYQTRIDCSNVKSLYLADKELDAVIKEEFVENGIKRYRLEFHCLIKE